MSITGSCFITLSNDDINTLIRPHLGLSCEEDSIILYFSFF